MACLNDHSHYNKHYHRDKYRFVFIVDRCLPRNNVLMLSNDIKTILLSH